MSIGRISSRVPCVKYSSGLPRGSAGPQKPGDSARMRANRSPFVSPTESEYDAPSEKPPMRRRSGVVLMRRKATARARSMNSTSLARRSFRSHETAVEVRRDEGDSQLVRVWLEALRHARAGAPGAVEEQNERDRRAMRVLRRKVEDAVAISAQSERIGTGLGRLRGGEWRVWSRPSS
jgi:hypothetical protein